MKFGPVFPCLLLVLGGLRPAARAQTERPAGSPASLSEARRGFTTHLVVEQRDGHPAPVPPTGVFDLVKYSSPAGEMAAYVSPVPDDGKKHPAIIWLTGGFSNSISALAWTPGPADNDQSATAFREAGIVTMYPSLRGGNDNPGSNESFYGEVDDVLAAQAWLARLPGIDPARIYLGGHSTGGTLALLTAECASVFRGVFAFGPVYGPRGYGAENLFYDLSKPKETELRAPWRWLGGIGCPTFVFEGTEPPSNVAALRTLAKGNGNGLVHFYPVDEVTHFSILRPLTRLLAGKIVRADGGMLTFTDKELADAVAEH